MTKIELENGASELVESEVLGNASMLLQHLLEFPGEYESEILTVTGCNDGDSRIREQWLVSDNLAHFLTIKNEVVVEIFGIKVWGRTTSGQAIRLDIVIEEIVQLRAMHRNS